jgi:predicted dehydrogenase
VSSRILRVGIMGAGWVASARHIPSYRRHLSAEVVALYDRREDRARSAAERMRIPRSSWDLSQFFDQELDVVSICTPPWTHAELAISALDRGAHVFTEKPMAMNESEARDMAAKASRSDRVLCVSHNFLFSRSSLRAQQWLPEIGQLQYAMGLQMSSPRRRLPTWYKELPAGLLFDESPHILYTLQHFLGPLSLDGVRVVLDGSAAPKIAEIDLAGSSALAQVTMMFEAPVSEWHIGLVGNDGVIGLDLFRDIPVRFGSDSSHSPLNILGTSFSALSGHARGFASSGARYVTRRLTWGHERLIHLFLDSVLFRRPSPVSLDDSIAVVGLMDSILEALKKRA